jgi:hypothetical protein
LLASRLHRRVASAHVGLVQEADVGDVDPVFLALCQCFFEWPMQFLVNVLLDTAGCT